MTDDGDPDAPSSPRGARRAPVLLGPGLIVAVIAVMVIPMVALMLILRSSGPTTYSYTVPAGTGARQDAGEVVSLMPPELRLEVGDHLVIVNEDDRTQTVGLFTVRPGETIDAPFPKAGEFKGACTMSANGQITIIVT